MSRWTSPDGHTVEVITLSGTGSADRDGQWLRVTRRAPAGRLLVVQVRTPAELAGLGVDLAALTEAGTEDSDLTLAA